MPRDPATAPDAARLDALLAFLPRFEQPGYVFGEWVRRPGQFPFYQPTSEVRQFLDALPASGLIIPYDWSAWRGTAQRYLEDPAALAGADLETLSRLLTLHVRQDRFVEGHLAAMLEAGHITALLRRLRHLRDQPAP